MEPDVRSHQGTFPLSTAMEMSSSHLPSQLTKSFCSLILPGHTANGLFANNPSDAPTRAVATERSPERLLENQGNQSTLIISWQCRCSQIQVISVLLSVETLY